MNTVTSQVTLFTDETVVCAGPIQPGPTLYEWAAQMNSDLGPNDYPSRAEYGQYLRWVFNEVVRRAPPHIEVEVHTGMAVRLDENNDGHQTLTLSNGIVLPGLAAVILAQGHLPLTPDAQQQKLAKYAKCQGLRYFTPANPADLDLSSIAPNEPVLLRGLGLNFFDHMALLTTGRGGHFTRKAGGSLRYHPSGNEPRLYAGSRRGIPYHARGDNAKGAYGRHMPVLLTDDVITAFRQRAEAGIPPDFLAEVWPLVTKEIELVYYEALMVEIHGPRPLGHFRQQFLTCPTGSFEEAELLQASGISPARWWSWDYIQRPYSNRALADFGSWRDWLLDYLRDDAAEAALGNVDGPLKAALDTMRDLRNELRLILDHDGLTGASRRDHLDHWYTPLNAFLSIGPPRQRIEQMIALIEAGVLDVLGPQLEVSNEDGAWIARSADIKGSVVRVTTLIEARLPEPDVRHTADELLSHLVQTGQARPYTTFDGYETGGLDVTPEACRVVDSQGQAHPRLFAVGVPTEGVHWVTAAGARPGVNSVTLADADAVARCALGVACTDTYRGIYDAVEDLKSWPLVDIQEVIELDI